MRRHVGGVGLSKKSHVVKSCNLSVTLIQKIRVWNPKITDSNNIFHWSFLKCTKAPERSLPKISFTPKYYLKLLHLLSFTNWLWCRQCFLLLCNCCVMSCILLYPLIGSIVKVGIEFCQSINKYLQTTHPPPDQHQNIFPGIQINWCILIKRICKSLWEVVNIFRP